LIYLLNFCNISLCVWKSRKFLWSIAISMVLLYINNLLDIGIFLGLFVRGVAVFKGLKIKQFLLIVNLGSVKLNVKISFPCANSPFVPPCNAPQSAS